MNDGKRTNDHVAFSQWEAEPDDPNPPTFTYSTEKSRSTNSKPTGTFRNENTNRFNEQENRGFNEGRNSPNLPIFSDEDGKSTTSTSSFVVREGLTREEYQQMRQQIIREKNPEHLKLLVREHRRFLNIIPTATLNTWLRIDGYNFVKNYGVVKLSKKQLKKLLVRFTKKLIIH
jgi:hypothetical protein